MSERVYLHLTLDVAGAPSVNLFADAPALFQSFADYLDDEPSAVDDLIAICKDAEDNPGQMVYWSDGDYIAYKLIGEGESWKNDELHQRGAY